jgi:hypothetical protein
MTKQGLEDKVKGVLVSALKNHTIEVDRAQDIAKSVLGKLEESHMDTATEEDLERLMMEFANSIPELEVLKGDIEEKTADEIVDIVVGHMVSFMKEGNLDAAIKECEDYEAKSAEEAAEATNNIKDND